MYIYSNQRNGEIVKMMNNKKEQLKDAIFPKIKWEGEEYDFYLGCDYHGLQNDASVRLAAQKILDLFPIKMGLSYYGYGINSTVQNLEKTAAKFFDTETVVTYPSGYLGNLILFRVLKDEYNIIFVDEESHYSMMDALQISGKPFIVFKHRDFKDLKQQMDKYLAPHDKPMIASDGIFPVTGEIAPIPQFLNILDKLGKGIICIDDSHGTGVLGDTGKGTYEYFGLKDSRLYFCGTMSKAIGSHGGIIPCSNEFKQICLKKGIVLKGATMIPNPILAASACAFDLLAKYPQKIKKLHENAIYFKTKLNKIGFHNDLTPTGIAYLTLPSEEDLKELSEFLKNNKVLTNYSEPKSYTSVPDTGAIKFTITSNHTKEQFDKVIDLLKEWIYERF